uniref:Uncharacterized protein n=1 Tax=Bactrocera dorsalis TaxID=27457 RepID=A0A034WS30_BACDO
MKNVRTPPPGSGKTSGNPETTANKFYQYETIINQQSRQLETIEQLCAELKKEIAFLKAENQNLKTKNLSPTHNEINAKLYATDEEELARETDWILKKRPSKKRKAELSPRLVVPATSNTIREVGRNQTETKISRPPPIMISGDCEYQKIYKITND